MVFEAASMGLRLNTIDRDLKPEEFNGVHESLTGFWWLLEVFPFRHLSHTSSKARTEQMIWLLLNGILFLHLFYMAIVSEIRTGKFFVLWLPESLLFGYLSYASLDLQPGLTMW